MNIFYWRNVGQALTALIMGLLNVWVYSWILDINWGRWDTRWVIPLMTSLGMSYQLYWVGHSRRFRWVVLADAALIILLLMIASAAGYS